MDRADNTAYRDYCAQYRDAIPIFHQDWWLDAVVGAEQWRGLVSRSKVNGVAAILPIYSRKKWGLSIIRNPPLTPYQGPWWAGYLEADYPTKHKIAKQLWPELLEQITPHVSFRQRFHPAVREALSWHEAGYLLGARYTFELDLAQATSITYANFRRDIKRQLKRDVEWRFHEAKDIEAFFSLIEAVYARQQQPPPYSKALLNRIWQEASKRQALSLTLAATYGKICGGLLVVKDLNRLYVLASGLNEQGRTLGAFPTLMWQLIQHHQGKSRTLDFCGSMLPVVADNNATFGAEASIVLEAKGRVSWLKLMRRRL